MEQCGNKTCNYNIINGGDCEGINPKVEGCTIFEPLTTKKDAVAESPAYNDRVRWELGTPPPDILMEVRCSDCIGDWYSVAMRKDYKKPPKGKSRKGFRKGWRWLQKDGNVFEGTVEAWRTRPT